MTRRAVPAALAVEPTQTHPFSLRAAALPLAPTVRSAEMLLLNEELARARMRERQEAAAEARLVRRLANVRRSQRRADRAARLARLAAIAAAEI